MYYDSGDFYLADTEKSIYFYDRKSFFLLINFNIFNIEIYNDDIQCVMQYFYKYKNDIYNIIIYYF